jgi:hypothetical protein
MYIALYAPRHQNYISTKVSKYEFGMEGVMERVFDTFVLAKK